MAELKTKQNNASVDEFLGSIKDEKRREDAKTICQQMEEVTGEPPKMWGSSIVGFGKLHYKSASGREGDWMMIGFSSRKTALTLYIMDGYEFEPHRELMDKLGKYKTGKSCLYIKTLEDIDMSVLRKLIASSIKRIRSGKFLAN